MPKEKASENAAIRLSLYLRYLKEMREETRISSEQLAEFLGTSGARVRKDLSYFGQFGTPSKGYRVGKLREGISKALGLDRVWPIALVGVGKLGRVLLNNLAFEKSRFHIQIGFDVNPNKIGKRVAGVKVYHPYQMPKIIRKQKIHIGMITAPAEAAQESADLLVISGIKGIFNFSSAGVVVPSYVKLKNVDFTSQLEVITCYIVNDQRFHLSRGN